MKRALFSILALLLFLTPFLRAAELDERTAARKAATDVSGAFANDGFKTRDGFWSGELKPRERAVIAVNLYAGNQYWFSAGSGEGAKALSVELYDEAGRRLATDPYHDGSKTAAGFAALNSGQYYVAVEITEGEPAICCLIYSYK